MDFLVFQIKKKRLSRYSGKSVKGGYDCYRASQDMNRLTAKNKICINGWLKDAVTAQVSWKHVLLTTELSSSFYSSSMQWSVVMTTYRGTYEV